MKVKIDRELEEIIPNYLKNREQDVVLISRYIAESNVKEIEVIAHKLAGSAGSYGFNMLGTYAKQLECASKNNDISQINILFTSIKEYLDCIEIDFVDLD